MARLTLQVPDRLLFPHLLDHCAFGATARLTPQIEIVATNLRFPDSQHLPDLDTTTPPSATRVCWSGSPFTNTTLLIDGQLTAPTTGFFHEHDFMGELNWALEVLYLALVALQVILALGNRPKGERLTCASARPDRADPADALSFWIFAFLSLYLIANTVYLTIMAFCPLNATIAKNGGSVFKTLTGSTCVRLPIALVLTLPDLGASWPASLARSASTSSRRPCVRGGAASALTSRPRPVAHPPQHAAVSAHRAVVHGTPRQLDAG